MTQSRCAAVIGVSVLLLVCAAQQAAAGCRQDSSNCPSDKICIKGKLCVNVCAINNLCGNNAVCHSNNHDFSCKCLPGYVPDKGRDTGCVLAKPTVGNRGGYPTNNQGGYQTGNQPGYQSNIRSGYPTGNQAGYPTGNQAGNQGGYPTGNQAGSSPGVLRPKQDRNPNKQWRGNQNTQRRNSIKPNRKQVPDDSVTHGPCNNYCGPNAGCKLFNNVPLCGCLRGSLGNPYDKNSGCLPGVPGQVDSSVCWGQDQSELSIDCLTHLKHKPRKQFTIMREATNWFEAHKLCEVENKMLAIIENRIEQERLESQLIEEGIDGRPFWIAGSDLKFAGRFQWVSGNTFSKMLFTNWHRQEPSGNNQHCVAMLERFDWGTRDCQEERYFVCQNK